MINKAFYYLLNMSIMGTLVGIIVLLVAKVFNKYISKKIIYAMWAVVAFRLLLPISISSKYSLVNLLGNKVIKTIPVQLEGVIHEYFGNITTFNSLLLVNNYSPLVYKTNNIEKIFTLASLVWFFGFLLCISVVVGIYFITDKRLNTAYIVKVNKKTKDNLYQLLKINKEIKIKESPFIHTPLVKGIFKPVIIIPKGMNNIELDYALLHECSHITRRDNISKIISVFISCIHWFNPFVWFFLHYSERDAEKACDEKILKHFNGEQRKLYASVLLQFAQKQKTPLLALGNTAVKERIINIIEYRKIPKIMIVITSALIGILAILLLTNPIIR